MLFHFRVALVANADRLSGPNLYLPSRVVVLFIILSHTNAQPTLVSRVDIVTTMRGVFVYLADISYNAHPLVLLFTLSSIQHIFDTPIGIDPGSGVVQ